LIRFNLLLARPALSSSPSQSSQPSPEGEGEGEGEVEVEVEVLHCPLTTPGRFWLLGIQSEQLFAHDYSSAQYHLEHVLIQFG